MKLLLSHRFFWPDTPPYALMLRDIAESLAHDGHEVHVFASQPSYRAEAAETAPRREQMGPLMVRRCFAFAGEKKSPLKRIANVVIYCLALIWQILRERPDVVSASTFPPVAAAWCASWASKRVGAKFIYHMQDIHPEVSVYSGGRMGRGVLRRLFTLLDNQTLRRAASIVVLSEDMADTLRARDTGALPITVINNFMLNSFDDAPPPMNPAYAKPPGTTRAIFAGNLGRFQNLPLLAKGVAQCFDSHPDLELMFLGSGEAEAELKATWGDHPQVRFAPFLPFAEAKAIIAEADIGLVALTPDIYRVAYPSKVLSYAGLGLPILALIEAESRMAKDLATQGIGAAPTPAADGTLPPSAIAEALESLLSQTPPREQVLDWYQQVGDAAYVLPRWQALVAQLMVPAAPLR